MKFFVKIAVLAALLSGQAAFAQVTTQGTTQQETARRAEAARGSAERQQLIQQAQGLFTSIRNWSTANNNSLNDSQIRRLAANMLSNPELKAAAEARMADTNAANQELNQIALQAMAYVGRDVVAGGKAESFSNFAINALGTDAATMTGPQRESAIESAKKAIAVLRANAGNFDGAMDAVATEVATRRGTKAEDMARVKQEIIENIRNLCKKA